ncbi:MAG: glycosyltransferase family 87 protein, partial [Terracidiphilus sp.]
MFKMRRIALFWILLSSGISIWWGSSIGQNGNGWVDFRAVYYGTRCLMEGHNPYKISDLEAVYRADGGERPTETLPAHQAVILFVNVPTSFLFVAPFALMPWGPAHWLWVILTAGVFILAAFLTWSLGAGYAPNLSLFLICILLVNCEGIFCAGNTAGLVIGLCVVAVWCFLEERFVWAGVLCMAVSLAIKPHDAGF